MRQLFENFTPRVELLFSFQFDHAIHRANTKSGIDAINGAFSNSNYGALEITFQFINYNDLIFFPDGELTMISARKYAMTPAITDKTPDQNPTLSNVSEIHSIGKS